MENFIPTENPFGLAIPPAWFLTALAAYDPLLVIFPSRCAPLYRMARRTSSGRAELNRVLQNIPDSTIYVGHKLWAWKSVEPQVAILGNGWQKLLQELPEYDQQRFGTADQCADQLDRLDVQQEEATDRDIQTGLDARNHDAWVLAQHRMGSSVGLSYVKPEGARPSRASRRRAYRPPNFGGGGAIFLGR
jgi:hypothetical protein